MDEAVLAVGERAARDGWDVYRPGGRLDPAFALPFVEEVKMELRRRLKQREASVLLSRHGR